MPVCAAIGCSNSKLLHRFPVYNESQVEKWRLAVGRADSEGGLWKPKYQSRLCREHFKDSDFVVNKTTGSVVLRPGVVPTIFPSSSFPYKTKRSRYARRPVKKPYKPAAQVDNDISPETTVPPPPAEPNTPLNRSSGAEPLTPLVSPSPAKAVGDSTSLDHEYFTKSLISLLSPSPADAVEAYTSLDHEYFTNSLISLLSPSPADAVEAYTSLDHEYFTKPSASSLSPSSAETAVASILLDHDYFRIPSREKDFTSLVKLGRFPRDPKLLEKWRVAVQRIDPDTDELWVPKSNNILCSNHFVDSDYQIRPGASYRLLREGAVPSVFPWSLTPEGTKDQAPLPLPSSWTHHTHSERPETIPPEKPVLVDASVSTEDDRPSPEFLAVEHSYTVNAEEAIKRMQERDGILQRKLKALQQKTNKFKAKSKCCVAGCKSLTKDTSISFHEFPTDEARSLQWSKTLDPRNSDDNLSEYPDEHRICSKHFTKDCYEIKVVDGIKMRQLKADALPTVFTINGEETPSKKRCDTDSIIESAPADRPLTGRALLKERDKFKRLYEQEQSINQRVIGTLAKMFTENQVTCILRRNRGTHDWSPESIDKALDLKIICGTSGYEYLRSIGFPLPALSTLTEKLTGSESMD